MNRISIISKELTPYQFRDSVHAALISAMREAGAEESELLGEKAKPWNFAPINVFSGGKMLLKGVTVSTSDEALGRIISRINPAAVSWNSTNGDRINFGDGQVRSFRNPIPTGGGSIQVSFSSPFVISQRSDGGKKTWIENLQGVDLGAAFSAGLSKRHGRQIKLEVKLDAFSALANAARSTIIAVRKAATRTITYPGFLATLQIEGTYDDLAAAYFSGLGEKTRYGFGLVVPAK